MIFLFSIERWLVPEKPKEKPKLPILVALKSKIPHQLSWHYVKNNYLFLGWLGIILLITVTLFAQRVVEFHGANPNATTWLVIARGCGKILVSLSQDLCVRGREGDCV